MVAEEGARLAAHELGLDAPPVQPDTHEKSERISPFQSSLLVPIFLLYSAETWTKEVRMYNFGRLIEIPSTVFRNLNKNQIDRQLTQFKLKLDVRKLFGTIYTIIYYLLGGVLAISAEIMNYVIIVHYF